MEPEPAIVTLADVGRVAGGYHQSTVSLVLRNRPGVSATTRRLIKMAARKLGYRRDPLLDAFNLHRIDGLPRRAPTELAFVAGFETRREMESSEPHRALWRGADAAARMAHCHLGFFPLVRGGMGARRLDAVLQARGIDAVILAALEGGSVPPEFSWERYCAVRIGCSDWDAPGDMVVPAMLPGARAAVRRMQALGYPRIGLVTTDGGERQLSDEARAGVLYELGQRPADEQVIPLDLAAATTGEEFRRWRRSQRVDALLAGAESYRRLESLVGGDGVRGLGRAWLDVTEAPPGAAGMIVDHERLAARAVERVAILRRIGQRGLARDVAVTQVPVGWRDGATLPRRRAGRSVSEVREL